MPSFYTTSESVLRQDILGQSMIMQSFVQDQENSYTMVEDYQQNYIDFSQYAKKKEPIQNNLNEFPEQELVLKQKEILRQLDSLRKKQFVVEMYQEQIIQQQKIYEYDRRTYLDPPKDQDQPTFEIQGEDAGQIQVQFKEKLDKKQILEDYDIKSQFMSVSEQEMPKLKIETMDIKADITNLTQLYLETIDKLKHSLPTDNVQTRYYKMRMKQTREKVEEENYHFSEQNSQSFRRSELSQGSIVQGSITSASELGKSYSQFESQRSDSISKGSLKMSQIKQGPEEPVLPIIPVVEEDKVIDTPCKPQITFINTNIIEDQSLMESKQLWQDFVSEMKSNPPMMSEILTCMKNQGFKNDFDQTHRQMLVNSSQMLYDNVHNDERILFAETNNFLKMFSKFALDNINPNSFLKDEFGNYKFSDKAAKIMVQCFFEGITRKLPSITFLRYIYSGTFTNFNVHEIEKQLYMLSQDDKYLAYQFKRKTKKLAELEAAKKAALEAEKAKRPQEKGFFTKLKGFFSSDGPSEKKKIEDSKQEEKRIAEASKYSKAQIKSGREKLYESLTQVYGDIPDPIKDFDPPVKEIAPDGVAIEPTLFDKVVAKMVGEGMNKFQFVYDEFPAFKFQKEDKIFKSSSEIKQHHSKNKPKEVVSVQVQEEQPRYKDMTYYIKYIVNKNLEKILFCTNKTPFTMRALMRIIICRLRDISDYNIRDIGKLQASEIKILAELFVAGWLNAGYRTPKSFGIQPSSERELELEYCFFRAARIVFEHMMLMQQIPDGFVNGIDIEDLNAFINKQACTVKVFWDTLINVDLSELKSESKFTQIESAIVKIDELELYFYYCTQLLQTPRAPYWANMTRIVNRITEVAEYQRYDSSSPDLNLIPVNMHNWNLSPHFSIITDTTWRQDTEEFEYYLLFLKEKSQQINNQELQEVYQSIEQDYQELNSEFVKKKIDKNNQNRVHITGVRQRSRVMSNQQEDKESDVNQLKQILVGGDAKPISKVIDHEEIIKTLQTIQKLLKLILGNKHIQFECLVHTKTNYKDLIQIIEAAYQNDKKQLKQNQQLQMACLQIIRLFKKLNVDLDGQLIILEHFQNLLEHNISQKRNYLNKIIVQSQQLMYDIEVYENAIIQLRHFNRRYFDQHYFAEAIAKQPPEVCLLTSTEVTPEFEEYRGVILNLHCLVHSNALAVSCFMIFGGINRMNEQIKLNQDEEKTVLMTEYQKKLKEAVDKRKEIFQALHSNHTKTTHLFQREKVELFAVKDEQLKSTIKLHQYYCQVYRDQIKALINGGPVKYNALLNLFSKQLEKECPADQDCDEQDKIDMLIINEPLDYFNLKKTYEMFLQNVSVMTSNQEDISYIDQVGDKRFYAKMHYDFLLYDLQAKAIRFFTHDYLIKRIQKSIFASGNPSEIDRRVHELVLKKQNDPTWQITSKESQQALAEGRFDDIKDFTKTPAWCDFSNYEPTINKILQINDAETPHAKELLLDRAIQDCLDLLLITAPYKKSDSVGAFETDRVNKFLLLETCKLFNKYSKQPRIWSNLLFILLFNSPQNEIATAKNIKQQKQQASQYNQTVDDDQKKVQESFLKLDQWEQYKENNVAMRGSKVSEWFLIIKTLLIADQKEKSEIRKQQRREQKLRETEEAETPHLTMSFSTPANQ